MKAIAVLLVLGFLLLINWCLFSQTQVTVHAVVTGKERITYRSGDSIQSKYLVFTDRETFENTDTVWAMKFNSSDIYGSLKEGQNCAFQVYGFRIRFMSSYRNIISATCGDATATSAVPNAQ